MSDSTSDAVRCLERYVKAYRKAYAGYGPGIYVAADEWLFLIGDTQVGRFQWCLFPEDEDGYNP